MSQTSNNNLNTCFTPLKDWSCISVIGPDAVDFLQNQLTNSVKSIANTPGASIASPHQQNRFAGYCTAKGRLMASFWITRQDADVGGANVENTPSQPAFYLFISKDLAATLAKRLSMFVLRSKVKVLDLTESMDIYGYATEANELRDSEEANNQLTKMMAMSGVITAELPAVSINQAQTKRYLLAAPKNQAMDDVHDAALQAWNWLEVQSAIPRITQATFEQFVPQMINMESLKGIDFQKGCYPGQEVVARSQYRGTIKRRLQVAHLNHSEAILPGAEIFHSEDPSQPCGMVVLAAPHPLVNDRIDVQVECKLEALQTGSVHLGSAIGPVLNFSALPYPLIEI